jgi:hypothetical protein
MHIITVVLVSCLLQSLCFSVFFFGFGETTASRRRSIEARIRGATTVADAMARLTADGWADGWDVVRVPPGTRYTSPSGNIVVVFYGTAPDDPVTTFDVV